MLLDTSPGSNVYKTWLPVFGWGGFCERQLSAQAVSKRKITNAGGNNKPIILWIKLKSGGSREHLSLFLHVNEVDFRLEDFSVRFDTAWVDTERWIKNQLH